MGGVVLQRVRTHTCTVAPNPGDGTDQEPRAVMKYSGDAESVEWFNMAFRKVDRR